MVARHNPLNALALRLSALLGLACVGVAAAAPTEAERAFERLQGLVGEWEGSYVWSGARSGGGDIRATYYLSGFGSTLIENLASDGVISMSSAYHLDGEDLRMTHFCGAANQPRLRAVSFGEEAVRFEFVDITNLAAPDAGHVRAFEIRFVDADRLALRFTFVQDGQESYEDVDLRRVE